MQEIQIRKFEISGAQVFTFTFLVLCSAGALLIGSFPLQLSIVTIFLFAGVHNFMEFRYFLARMPLRWGRSKTFYLVGIGGVVVLTASYLMLYFASGNWLWSIDSWTGLTAAWNTGFVFWIGTLVYLRGKQKSLRDWGWAFAIAFLLALLAWLIPQYWSLGLVYLHPFIAMWFLERQMRRTKPEWLRAYHFCLGSIPVFLVVMWMVLADQANLSQESNLFWRIAQHSGSEILPGISSHFLVAAHVFLETIHYMVWIVLIPLIDFRAIPWKVKEIPLAANRNGFPKLVFGAMAVSVGVIIILWVGFTADYTTTRDIYFAVAIGHVLAEFPFLVKML